ncbi:C-type lectin 37Da-like [Drosophila obscura]|uniref:C-type lectin 37Da-like n=1 Tax=Drosophila obscura TaxID=7282 RepID=UPI000B9FB8F1|nr:C-type lectin 37Da-like [Drosophila obscura]
MLLGCTGLVACLGFLSLCGAYKVTPIVADGLPGLSNITTEPFVKIGNGYYYIESTLNKNWFDAFESCRRMSADLISFESLEEWDLINDYIVERKINGAYWTSGNDFAYQGKHVWHSTGEPVTLNIWNAGDPNNHGGNEHCDEFWYATNVKHNVLNDKQCSVQSHYICEAPQPKTASFIIW